MKMILPQIVIAVLLFNCTALEKQNANKITGLSNPESVIVFGNNIYVSNIGKKEPTDEKDGDGFICKLSAEGEMVDENFIGNLDAPKGMAIVGNVLYVTDLDKVKGFDVSDGKQVFLLDFASEKTMFLNDLATWKNGKLIVSATDINKVYEIDLASGKFSGLSFSAEVTGANGLFYDSDNDIIYIATNGENGKILKAEKNGEMFRLSAVLITPGSHDGLFVNGDILLTSDWTSGAIKKINLKTSVEEQLKFPEPEKFSGPADFAYDLSTKTILIPEMKKNVLWKYKVQL